MKESLDKVLQAQAQNIVNYDGVKIHSDLFQFVIWLFFLHADER
jgi:hypothetical protein